jgi:hypothetical protein
MRWVWAAFAGVGLSACALITSLGGLGGGTADGGVDASAADAATVTAADWCDAESKFYGQCQADACVKELSNCGPRFAALRAPVAAAAVRCVNLGEVPCGTDLFNALWKKSSCTQEALASAQNDSGAYSQLAAQYCSACAPGNAQCPEQWSTTDQAGFFASLLVDVELAQLEQACTGYLDGGSDGGGCGPFDACVLITIASQLQVGPCF